MAILGLINVFKLLAIALGAGAATVVIAQSVAAVHDKQISPDEQNLLMLVMVVLRLALLLLLLSCALFTAVYFVIMGLTPVHIMAFQTVQAITWLMIAVLFVTFVFIDRKVISRQVGATVMLTSWYALVFVSAWPTVTPIQMEAFVFAYTIFSICAVYIVQKTLLFTVDTHTVPSSKRAL